MPRRYSGRLRRGVEAHHFEALGTNCSLFAVGLPPGRLFDGEFWVRRMGARLTRFSPASELSRFNASSGRWTEISPELESLLGESLHAFDKSSGLVNVAVLAALQAVGYTRPMSEGQPLATVLQARPLPPLRDVLAMRPGAARLEPGAGIDLGGIAKGWMADRLPVGLGGATVLLRDQGAATSSVRRRRWSVEHHHLIDPRTGVPAQTGLEEVSVVAANGVEAEVVAKTALLVGPEVAPAYCAAHALAWWLSP
jgi:thiamine biosynthesis lipoprotein